MKRLIDNICRDLEVELRELFDQNFSDGSWFGRKWQRKRDGTASHLQRTSHLRKSLRYRRTGSGVQVTSSQPYASIHNEGGEIEVTRRMKRFFWAQYYKAGKRGKEAEEWRALALKPVGSKIRIPERRFVGDHPRVHQAVKEVVDAAVEEIAKKIGSR